MDKRVIEVAKQYLDQLPKEYRLKEAYVFGSHIKGTATKHSDIDLALILDSNKDLFDLTVELMNLRDDNSLEIEPHPFHAKDFYASSWAEEIIGKGIQIR
jgi:predicted nucleotidyltransferase